MGVGVGGGLIKEGMPAKKMVINKVSFELLFLAYRINYLYHTERIKV